MEKSRRYKYLLYTHRPSSPSHPASLSHLTLRSVIALPSHVSQRKTRTHVVGPPSGAVGAPESELTEKVPKSFVLKKGKVHSNVSDLAEEMRRVMEPHTARKLRERAKNTVKDYVSVSSVLGVTHLLVFTQTDKSLSLRVCRTPTGPTLTFKVQQFSLMRHVRALQKRPVEVNQAYKTSPLVSLASVQIKSLLRASMYIYLR